MKKLIKYTIASLIGFIVVFVLVVATLITLVNPNRFKPVIEKSVYEATGRALIITGDINWKIYPNLGIKLNYVTLSNPTEFMASSNFMSFKSADVAVALLPLLRKHIAFKTLAIDGLHVSLIKKNGANNWTFNKPSKVSTVTTADAQKPQPLKLELGGFSLTHANIDYDDFDNKKHYKLSNAKLILETGFGGEVFFDQAQDLINLEKVQLNYNDQILANLNFKINDLSNPKFNGEINVTKLMLQDIATEFNLLKNAKKINMLNDITFKGKINGDKTQVKIQDFNFSLNNKINGVANINMTNFSKMAVQGDFKLEPFNLNQILNDFNVSNSSRINKSLLNSFAIKSNFQITETKANFTNLSFNFASDLAANANLYLQNYKSPTYYGDINFLPFSLNNIMRKLGESAPNLANKQWLERVSFSSGLQGSTNSLTLKGLKLGISETVINGELSFNSFKPIILTENLFVNSLDMANISNINGYRVPVKQIQLNGDSTLNLANPLQTLTGRQTVKAGNITLKGISCDELVLELDKNINKVGQGNDNIMKILMNSADILQAVNKMQREVSDAIKPGKRDLNKSTNLGNFTLNTTINKGIINPSDFKLNGPSVEVHGSGAVNLVTKALNYKAMAKINVNGINPIFKKLEFPVVLSGSTVNPNATLNWQSIEQQLIHYAVNQNKGQIQNVVKQGINQTIGDQIKKSLGDKNADKTVDDVSKQVTNAIGGLFGGGNQNK